ncbi:MAG: AIM24 family protein, partial [Candidatus Promineifilaceae bacterium]
MKVDVRYQPAFALAFVELDADESIQVEAGAMVGMSPDLKLITEARGGLFKSLTRSIFGGESFFLNTYTARKAGDSVALAPPLPGDINVIE